MFFKKFIAAAAAAAILLTSAVTANADVVSSRDFTQYRSDCATANLTKNERELYNRLDDVAMRFLTDSSADAEYNLRNHLYHIDFVTYSDLFLSRDAAHNVAIWFKINNPQYYFLAETNLTMRSTSSRSVEEKIAIAVYDFAADGEARAIITESLFDVVDEWVKSVTDDEVTTYQKELSINNLICDELDYDLDSAYNQSVFSSVMNKSTVCAGYAAAFSMLCNAADIDCLTVSSSSHGWNLVKLDDGKWYAVDTTWNDSTELRTYIFNCGENSVSEKDENDSHVYDFYSAKWKPVVSAVDYEVTEYDETDYYLNSREYVSELERKIAIADVNNDGYINSKDATTILKMVVGMIPKNGLKGDVNDDGSVNSKDATEILKYVAGLPNALNNV